MSHKKNIERFKEKGPFRQGTTPPATRYRCPFPGCDWTFTLEAGNPECCDKHRKMVAEYFFIQDHVHRTPKPPQGIGPEALVKSLGDRAPKGSVILIPKPGQADAAVRQAAQESEAAKGAKL